jgi:hypothetical protein
MNVPLQWLSDYVALPKSETALTDKLTMVGHMLDKRKVVGDAVVIDLELRGNSGCSDYRCSRDVSACLVQSTPFRCLQPIRNPHSHADLL